MSSADSKTKDTDLNTSMTSTQEGPAAGESELSPLFSPSTIAAGALTSGILLGLVFNLLLKKKRDQDLKLLKTEGVAREVKVVKIHYRTDLMVKGRHPWVIHAIHINENDHKKAKKFLSEPLDFDPSFYLGLNDILIAYFDSKNEKRYFLDVSNIKNSRRLTLKKSA